MKKEKCFSQLRRVCLIFIFSIRYSFASLLPIRVLLAFDEKFEGDDFVPLAKFWAKLFMYFISFGPQPLFKAAD